VSAEQTSTANKTVTVTCNGTRKVLGGGGIINDNNPQINDSYPSADNAWTVSGAETGFGTGSNWTLTVWAVCADIS
jgi:hypothetical protein